MNILEDLKTYYRRGGAHQQLIVWNVGVFVLSFLFYSFKNGTFLFPNWLALSSDSSVFFRNFWTVFTYMFLHNGFLHLLFNILVLNFSAQLFVTFFTHRQLFRVYILGGLFSGLAFVGIYGFFGNTVQLVGASGAIMAVLAGVAVYAPYMELRLALIGKVKVWHIAAILVFIDLIQLPVSNGGGHLAHLAGAFFGFLYVKLLQNGIDLTKGVLFLQDILKAKKEKRTKLKTVHKNTNRTSVNIKNKDENQRKIDEILDKISQSGYDSLTKAEKDFLFRAGK